MTLFTGQTTKFEFESFSSETTNKLAKQQQQHNNNQDEAILIVFGCFVILSSVQRVRFIFLAFIGRRENAIATTLETKDTRTDRKKE